MYTFYCLMVSIVIMVVERRKMMPKLRYVMRNSVKKTLLPISVFFYVKSFEMNDRFVKGTFESNAKFIHYAVL